MGDVALEATSFGEGWVEPTAQIRLQLDGPLPGGARSIAIFIGTLDATAMFHESAPGEFTYLAPQAPLPSGEQELIVYSVIDRAQWREIGRAPLRVLTASGFQQVEITPQLEVSIDMQNDQGTSGDAFPPERRTYQDLHMRAGLTTLHQRQDLTVTSRFSVVGTSFRKAALRFGTKGEDAPKIDLSDYLVEVQVDQTRAQLGHVSYGNHPLLLNGLSNRGVLVEHRFNEVLDASFSSQSGVSIVGYDRLLGIGDSESRFSAATVGVELLPERPGGLRAELSYVTAEVPAVSNFGVGQVPVSEQSSGYGIRLTGMSESARLRGDFNFARSSYTNPTDSSLEFDGTPIVDVEETTNNAYSGRVEYDLFVGQPIGEHRQLNLTAFGSYEQVDPQYKTLAAFPNSDRRQGIAGVNARLGDISLQAQYSMSRDNLENIPTILTTKTNSYQLNLAGPLRAVFDAQAEQNRWWPMFRVAAHRVHQYAGNAPATADSDFNNTSHLPDQISTSANVGLDWNFEQWDFGYQFAYSLQDNRQTGRELADFRNKEHSVNAVYRATERLTLGARVGRSENYEREFSLTRESDTFGANVDWRLTDRLSVSGSYDNNRNTDDLGLASSKNDNLNTQLVYRFELPGPEGRKLPGQAFVRYARQFNESSDNVFGFNSSATTWALNSGVSLTIY